MAAAIPPGWTPSHGARQAASLGAGEILLTSMDRDGTGRKALTPTCLRAVCGAVRVPVVASGGVGTAQHFVEGAEAGCHRACWPPRSSISAASPSPGVKQALDRCGPAGSPLPVMLGAIIHDGEEGRETTPSLEEDVQAFRHGDTAGSQRGGRHPWISPSSGRAGPPVVGHPATPHRETRRSATRPGC